jgi:hypothetical protein
MPRPDKLPEWASGADASITEPPTQKKQLGWITEKVPHDWMNWLFGTIYDWLVWLDENVVPVPEIGFLYRFGSPAEIVLDASPINGWATLAGAPVYDGGPPRELQSGVVGTPVELMKPLDLRGNNLIAGSYQKITAISMTYRRTDPADVVRLKLFRAKRDGTGSSDNFATLTGDSTTGLVVTKSDVLNHDVDGDLYSYWVEAEVEPAAVATDCGISFGKVTVQKTRIE